MGDFLRSTFQKADQFLKPIATGAGSAIGSAVTEAANVFRTGAQSATSAIRDSQVGQTIRNSVVGKEIRQARNTGVRKISELGISLRGTPV